MTIDEVVDMEIHVQSPKPCSEPGGFELKRILGALETFCIEKVSQTAYFVLSVSEF